MEQQPGPSNARPVADNRKRLAEESIDDVAAADDQPEVSQSAAAVETTGEPQDESGSDNDESDVDSSDDTDDVDSDEEEKQGEAQREPQIDPASLESETFENDPPDQIEPVWKDYLKEENGDKKVREHVVKVVSDPKSNDKEPVSRGIQPLYNSTTTDCALYAMFATNDTFDYLFKEKKARSKDPVSVVRILKDYVVTPLRKIGFVGAKRTIALKLAMQRAGDLEMKSVIGERKVSEFLVDMMESMYVDPQFYTVQVDPRSHKVLKSSAYSLEVDVKLQLIDNDPVPYSSQQLIEQYTLDQNIKITNPRNLVLHLNRGLTKRNQAVPVFPLRVISLLDSMTGVFRRCAICELVHNKITEAELQCHTCFRIDHLHMQLKNCMYCDQCNKNVHDGGLSYHLSSPLYGSKFDEQLKETTEWIRKDKKSGEVEAVQVTTNDNDEPSYEFELYAIVCENLNGHVAYVSADVELPRTTIEKYSKPCEAENQSLESPSEPMAAAADPDATTKPKDPADAAPAQPTSSVVSDTANTTSDTAMNSAERGQSGGLRKGPEEELPVWLLFNPEEITEDDSRGGYCLPQVHTVTNLDDLLSINKSGNLDPFDKNPVNQQRYRILCESIAMFYRPIMRTVKKSKTQIQSSDSNTGEEQVQPSDV